jgi:FtsZ-binding cell division protein ZapB
MLFLRRCNDPKVREYPNSALGASGYPDEVKANVVRLVQLESEVKRAEQTLAGLNAQIENAKKLAAEVQQVDQQIRTKRCELADLDAQIARKHEAHGKIDGDLRSIQIWAGNVA